MERLEWIHDYDEKDFIDYAGFIYVIKEKSTGKLYIGQKTLKKGRRTRKGKKTRIKYVLPTWKKYYGSNEYIKQRVKEGNEDDYERHILCLCDSKVELNYIELKLQLDLHAIFSNIYHNKMIHVRIGGNQVNVLKKNMLEIIKKINLAINKIVSLEPSL